MFYCTTSFATSQFQLTENKVNSSFIWLQDSARDKNIDVTDVIQLDDYIPNQVETINKIARKTYQRTRGKLFFYFYCFIFLSDTVYSLIQIYLHFSLSLHR